MPALDTAGDDNWRVATGARNAPVYERVGHSRRKHVNAGKETIGGVQYRVFFLSRPFLPVSGFLILDPLRYLYPKA